MHLKFEFILNGQKKKKIQTILYNMYNEYINSILYQSLKNMIQNSS